MRALILIFLVGISCMAMAQEPRPDDPKSLYEQAMNKLNGVPPNQNFVAGIDLMTRSADKGYLPALVALGYIYESGEYSAGNPSKAADYDRKAADQGSHLAEYQLGRLYYTGNYGTSRRDGEKWLQAAADAGNPFAAYLLGVSIYDRDPAAALPRFRAAAEQGLPSAQYRLARALLEGRPAPVNKYEAYLWLFVSREAGIGEAATDMSLLESSLGTADTEKAKSEARELQSRVRRSVVAKGCTGWQGELDPVPTLPPLNIQRYCE